MRNVSDTVFFCVLHIFRATIQGVPGGKVNILEGHSVGHSKQKYLYEHVSYSVPLSTINWPPRSPDLTPLDFYLWGLMKSEVYRKKKVDRRDELLVNILYVIACIKERQDALRRTTRHVFTRVAKCIDVDGGIFEHLL